MSARHAKQIQIRAAARDDLADIVRIYNHYVETSHVTLDTTSFSIEEREPWFNTFASSGPYRLFVALVDDRIVGYASSLPLKEKPGYATSVETSVYVDAEFQRRGVGRALYAVLLEELSAEPEVHRAYGVIGAPNTESMTLHKAFGFDHVGTLRSAGKKFGQFWDVVWYEKDLSESVASRK